MMTTEEWNDKPTGREDKFLMTHIIERWTNGSWVLVAKTVSSGTAKVCTDALSEFGGWEYRWREL